MHEAGALPVGSGRKRRGGNDGPGVLKNICSYGGKPPALVVEAAGVFDKDRNIIVGIRLMIAPRARAVQDNTLQTVALDFGHGDTEALQHRFVLRFVNHPAHCSTTVAGVIIPIAQLKVLSFANPKPPDCRGIWPFSPRFNLSVIDRLAGLLEEAAQ